MIEKIAALYDIHGNLPALEAVIDEIGRLDVDLILVGGDVVPGPMPRETLDALLALGIPTAFILGNGDREVAARIAGVETSWYRRAREEWREPVRWTAEQLTAEDGRVLGAWPATRTARVAGLGDVLFCHATPRNDTDSFTRLTPEAQIAPLFADAGAPLVVCGHTHMHFDRTIAGVRVVNAGSVGMPFGQPGAYWLLLGDGIEPRRTPYDLAAAAARVRATAYPQAEEFAARHVLEPPSEAQMLPLLSGHREE